MRDPYDILGVSKTADAAEIKSAYRKLAKKLHPDVNPGRKDIEQKFKEVTAAYDLLSDPAKRARFDRGEIDAMGNERGFAGGNPFGGGRTQWRTSSGRHGFQGAGDDPFSAFGGGGNIDDIIAEFMNASRRGPGGAGGGPGAGPHGAASMRGADTTYSLAVPFVEACLGGKRRVTLASGKNIDVTLPPATAEGHKLRLRGQGETGPAGAGDAIVEIHVEPHPFFVRKDGDIHLDVPVSLPEALSGASIKVPTLDGAVTVKVPPGANSDTVLRLKGKGVPAASDVGACGDMFARLKIMLPDPPSPDLAEIVGKWAKKHAYDPRRKLGW